MARTRNPYLIEMPDGSRIERSYRKEGKKRVPFGNWKWVVYDPDKTPKRPKVNLYTQDKALAREKAMGYIRDRRLGAFDPWEDAPRRSGTTMLEALEPYLKAKRRAGGSDSTLATDRNRIEVFAAMLPAGATLATVSRKHVERFLNRPKKNGKPRANGTKNRDRATVLHFFGWAVENGMTATNPAAGVKPWKTEDNRRDHATADELDAILRAITAAEVATGKPRQWLKDWIVFGFGSGLRPDEMRELRWSAVHLAERRVEVCLHHRGKTKKSRRTIYVAGDALAVLQRRHAERKSEKDGPVFTGAKGGTINVGAATKRLKEFTEAAGISKNLVTYGLRHGFGTNMTAASKPVIDVSRMMGTGVRMLEEHYAHFDPRRGAAHVEDVYGEKAEDAETAAKARERFELGAGLHRDGRLTLAEAAAVAEMEPGAFGEALKAQNATATSETGATAGADA